MTLSIIPIPVLSDNYAWLAVDAATGTVAVVDPGEAAPVAQVLGRDGRLDLILLTHHHADHVGGVAELRRQYGARVIGNGADAARLPALDIAVAPGDQVAIGESRGVVIDTPGHTLGHVAFYFADSRAVFTGDTLFSLGCGRLFEGTAADMFGSLGRLKALPDNTMVYAGHEYTMSNAAFARHVEQPHDALAQRCADIERLRAEDRPTLPVALGVEKATNPFLRAPDVASLARLRQQKDSF
ncbi:hydroxyacylglutathione hydrolase [Ameyamaea chiangmaiensis]|uniref:Hydroxyacylglutathione hydrolase n=1 Tax=Ameyamaea chiangmaiensis TaxID=442969 RepID=A0A850PB44_9PROT|nr:hydroxyacylglutathione hydrolase [Ameyamaea chiangmaiensis]MBS4074452.1 hydroxyacylglutathione hydrolase [Ameyamaea chiangmaiensis]NVN41765.1 hydroxyacylglutathione hydrolase [Ameyamaea chiangmaiensis]